MHFYVFVDFTLKIAYNYIYIIQLPRLKMIPADLLIFVTHSMTVTFTIAIRYSCAHTPPLSSNCTHLLLLYLRAYSEGVANFNTDGKHYYRVTPLVVELRPEDTLPTEGFELGTDKVYTLTTYNIKYIGQVYIIKLYIYPSLCATQ